MEKAIVRDPSLFKANLQKAGMEDEPEVLSPLKNWSFCETGSPPFLNLRKNEENQTLYFPGGIDEELEQWLKMIHIQNCQLLVIFGVGLGYHYLALKPWLEESEEHLLLFVEEDPEVMHAFLETSIASEMLSHPQIKVSYKGDVFKWQYKLNSFLKNTFFLKKRIYSIFSYYKYKNRAFRLFEIYFDLLSHNTAQSESEYLVLGEDFHRQFFQNFLHIADFKRGSRLFDRFKGCPAIICGAGPSLSRHEELLKSLKDKALILAGGTAMNALNALGIIPHLGAGLDPFKAQMSRILENNAFMVPYFLIGRMFAEGVNALSGEKLYISGDTSYPISNWLENQAGFNDLNGEMTGANVVHFCLHLASYMGCNPIVFIGVDLAFTGGTSYSKGVQVHGTFEPNNYLLSKHKESELILVNDIYGQPIHTQSRWVFESMIYDTLREKFHHKQLINCTEGGLGLQGLPNQKLADVVKSWETQGDLCGKLDAQIAALEENDSPPFEKTFKLEVDLLGKVDALLQQLEKIPEGEKEEFLIQEVAKDEGLEHLFKPFLKMMEPVSKEEGRHVEIRQKLFEDKEKFLCALLSIFQMSMSDALRSARLDEAVLRRESAGKAITPHDEGVYRFHQGILEMRDPRFDLDYKETVSENEYDDTSKTGWKRVHDALGNVIEESYYVDGLLNGPARHYSETGALLGSSWFIKGKRTGIQKSYFSSGALCSIKGFKNGIEEGVHLFLFSNGHLKAEIPYKEGRLSGAVTIYYKNGTVKRRVEYENGLRHGSDQYRQPNGKLLSETFYKQQKPYGTAKVWDRNGVLIKEIRYFLPGVIYKVINYNSRGIEIEHTGEGDFYDVVVKKGDQLQKSMNSLADSLEKVFGSLNAEDTLSLNGIKEELKGLDQMAASMKQQAGLVVGEYQEPIWQSEQTKESMIKSIDQMTAPMIEEMKVVQDQLKLLYERLKNEKGGK